MISKEKSAFRDCIIEMGELSRQRKWQIKKLGYGYCSKCNLPRVNSELCEFHRLQKNETARKKRLDKANDIC